MRTKKIGNFRIDNDGHIEFYVGWCAFEYKDMEDLATILQYTKVYSGIPTYKR